MTTAASPRALVLLDYFGIAVFAVSGALLAAEKRQTLVTFIFFAVVTGVGGGTMRDLLIGAPVFWVHTNATLLICIGAALARLAVSATRFAGRALLWFDAVGLAAYATYGAAKALNYGVAPVPAFAMGVMTACVGGHHPRRACRRAVDPDAARALRHRRRARLRPVRRLDLLGVPPALAALVAGLPASPCAARHRARADRCRPTTTRLAALQHGAMIRP